MKIKHCVRGLSSFALAVLLVIGLAAPMGMLLTVTTPTPASANSELHPGGRLFFPAWDIQGQRRSFLIITRLAMFEKDVNAAGELKNVVISGDPGIQVAVTYDWRNNCQPLHNTYDPAGRPQVTAGGITLTTSSNKIADDVHLEFYGKSCQQDSEILKMSCSDIDLIFLSAGNIGKHFRHGDQQGSLDVHFVINGNSDRNSRVHENSLMGYGVIADPTQGWVAAYPAAAAKSTLTPSLGALGYDGGTPVGYEAFPSEVFLPFALADGSQGGLDNELYLWAPTFYPGALMPNSFSIDFNWYDGRERRFFGDTSDHALIDFLDNLDPVWGFSALNWTCDKATVGTQAEYDGAPGAYPACTGLDAGSAGDDTAHPSDNLQTAANGFTNTAIGWWDFEKTGDSAGTFQNAPTVTQARGLVGVVISRTGTGGLGNGDAIRLWHKDPCEIAPRGQVGPPHVRDRVVGDGDLVRWNAETLQNQYTTCNKGVAF